MEVYILVGHIYGEGQDNIGVYLTYSLANKDMEAAERGEEVNGFRTGYYDSFTIETHNVKLQGSES